MASSKGPINKIKLTAKQQEQLRRSGDDAALEGKELEERIAPMRVG